MRSKKNNRLMTLKKEYKTMEQAKMLKVEVYVKTRKNKATKHEFKCYSCKMKDGKWYDLKFTKDVPEGLLPKSHSFIYVQPKNLNIDKSKKYLVVWVKGVEYIEAIERPVEDLEQYFEFTDSVELPF